MTVSALRTYFIGELKGYYPDTEIRSFFYLLSDHILNLKKIDIALNQNEVIKEKNYHKFQIAVERLKTYEPIQYILGETEFYGLKFKVNNSVLIPRPETEELVDWIIKSNSNKANINILDIGTGSGCIAISLAKNFPNAEVFALDVSEKAISVAKKNANKNNIKIEFINQDILNVSSDFGKYKFDVIVSNPPYVRMIEKEQMQANVLDFEPHLALFVEDNDALVFYKAVVEFANKYLKDKGQLYFEINESLGKSSSNLLEKANFINIELRKDISEKDRMLKGIKNE